MFKKLVLLSFLFLGCIGGYSLVFGGNLIFTSEVSYAGSISKNIYLGDEKLDSTILIYKANTNISKYSILSSCAIESRFLESYKGLYFFEVDFQNADTCKNGNVTLSLGEDIFVASMTQLNLKNQSTDIEMFIDYSTKQLESFEEKIEKEVKKYSIYKNYNNKEVAKYYTLLKGQRRYLEAMYRKNIITAILNSRSEKYVSPVPGGDISEQSSKIPNAGRPYRETYTDGIHHGWDISGKLGTKVVSLDDAVVVRVVRDFDDSDFSRIVYSQNLSYEQKLKNLDILRGKQVWIKTMKGDVVFYSHLEDIPLNIQEGILVSQGEELGQIGVTGVPEKGYTDYHLHFSIMKNPYVFEKAGTYDFGDYMSWKWAGQGKNYEGTIQEQKSIFQ